MSTFVPKFEKDLPEDNVSCCDELGCMKLYSYKDCTNETPRKTQALRGAVYKSGELVLLPMPFVRQYRSDEIIPADDRYLRHFKRYSHYYCPESTCIRLFYCEDAWSDSNWHVSTSKRIDASNAYWGDSTRSFKTLFEDVFTANGCSLDEFTDTLDKHTCYYFLLTPNKDTRIVCRYKFQSIYCFGSWNYKTGYRLPDDRAHEGFAKYGVEQLVRVKCLKLADAKYVSSHTSPLACQGIISIEKDGKCVDLVKMVSREYDDLSKLRGNVSNVLLRYLEVRQDRVMRKKYVYLYSDKNNQFKDIEARLKRLEINILKEYVDVFIRKIPYTKAKDDESDLMYISPMEYHVLRACHSWYLEDPRNRRMAKTVVSTIITQMPSYVIWTLLYQ
jgi:hypothetical protein